MVCRLAGGPSGPELGDDHPEDGDEEEGVGGEEEEHGAHVDPLVTGRLHEWALVVGLRKICIHWVILCCIILTTILPECYFVASFVSPPKLCSE